MKCPKCGYVSFDYNLACPKCNRDISAEQAKLNIPAFEPHTPSLLGALTGDTDESHVGLQFDRAAVFGEPTTEVDLAVPDTMPDETGEFSFEVSEKETLSLEKERLGDMEGAGEGDIEFGGLGDVDLADEEPAADREEEEASAPEESASAPVVDETDREEEELTLDLGELADEEETVEEGAYDETGAEDLTQELRKINFEKVVEDEEWEVDGLDDLEAKPAPGFEFMEMNYEELPSQEISTEAGIDLETQDAFEAAIPEEEEGLDKEEIQLSLDDLKINETGELEIGRDIPIEKPAEEEGLEELSLEESSEAEILGTTVSLEYEELELEEPAPGLEMTTTEKEGFEETLIELDEITLTEEAPPKTGDTGGDDLPPDLENLDLELDLDEKDDKPK